MNLRDILSNTPLSWQKPRQQTEQERILASLRQIQSRGISLLNYGSAIKDIIDALYYLVQNTPEVKK